MTARSTEPERQSHLCNPKPPPPPAAAQRSLAAFLLLLREIGHVQEHYWGSARAIEDLPAALVERLVHYFSTYKMRPGHPSAAEVLGTYGVAHAHAVIAASIRDYDRAIANVTVR